MSRPANPYDNASCESFMKTLEREEIYANDEVITMVQTALRDARPEDREAFILFTIEGFTIRELSAITDRKEDDVRASIRSARELLKRGMPISDPLKSRIVERAKIA